MEKKNTEIYPDLKKKRGISQLRSCTHPFTTSRASYLNVTALDSCDITEGLGCLLTSAYGTAMQFYSDIVLKGSVRVRDLSHLVCRDIM